METEIGLVTAADPCDEEQNALQEAKPKMSKTQRGQLYACIATAGLFLGFAGFVPAYIRRLRGDPWYYEAISSVNFGPAAEAAARFGKWWENLLTLHAITTVLWTALVLHQLATGSLALAAKFRIYVWHRRIGYASVFVGMSVVAEAFLLLLHMRFDLSYVAKGVTAVMIACNLVFGVHYARCKKFDAHKFAMMWACLWSAAPGHTRVFAYLRLIFFRCPVSKPVGLLTCSTFLGVLLVSPTIALAMSERHHMKLLVLNGIAVFAMFRVDAEDVATPQATTPELQHGMSC